ncbi:hypothetical protein IFM89_033535 [Coptis chinensis]|uniref:Aminotransferase class V domain-containing protein n=1 Tax=Coptis chinensis TaxID=261450 RepID=A0A835LH56_9MAGN|nr:hypothetical protein IFM89_033535 [Coptis chinensis]
MSQMCGPTVFGFLYGKSKVLSRMPPFLVLRLVLPQCVTCFLCFRWWRNDFDVFLDHSTYANRPPSEPANWKVLAKSSLCYSWIELATYLHESLCVIPNVRIYGPVPSEHVLVLPIKDITSWSHNVGAKVLVDACQSVPHMVVDVQSLDADFLVASSHKWLYRRESSNLGSFRKPSRRLGSVLPIKDITSWSHNVGAKVLVDACQSVPHMMVDVQSLDADFLVASSHKMCGPTGAGFLYGKSKVLSRMPPFLGGGEMISDVFLDHSTYAE